MRTQVVDQYKELEKTVDEWMEVESPNGKPVHLVDKSTKYKHPVTKKVEYFACCINFKVGVVRKDGTEDERYITDELIQPVKVPKNAFFIGMAKVGTIVITEMPKKAKKQEKVVDEKED